MKLFTFTKPLRSTAVRAVQPEKAFSKEVNLAASSGAGITTSDKALQLKNRPLETRPLLMSHDVPSAIRAPLRSTFANVLLGEEMKPAVPKAVFNWLNSALPHSPVSTISVALFKEDGMSSAATETGSCALETSAQDAIITKEKTPLNTFPIIVCFEV